MSALFPGCAYLAALLVSLAGLGFLDWRHRVALFADAKRTLATVGVGVALFLVWDLAGVGLGIFFRGVTPFMTGWQIAREIPVEEVFFLTLLCYLTMNLYSALELGAKAISGIRRDASADGRPARRSRGVAP